MAEHLDLDGRTSCNRNIQGDGGWPFQTITAAANEEDSELVALKSRM